MPRALDPLHAGTPAGILPAQPLAAAGLPARLSQVESRATLAITSTSATMVNRSRLMKPCGAHPRRIEPPDTRQGAAARTTKAWSSLARFAASTGTTLGEHRPPTAQERSHIEIQTAGPCCQCAPDSESEAKSAGSGYTASCMQGKEQAGLLCHARFARSHSNGLPSVGRGLAARCRSRCCSSTSTVGLHGALPARAVQLGQDAARIWPPSPTRSPPQGASCRRPVAWSPKRDRLAGRGSDGTLKLRDAAVQCWLALTGLLL
jgi:hypothetical protein